MVINTKYGIGDELKDIVSGYKGIVMAITQYSTGCIHYGIIEKGQYKKEDWVWHDESRFKLVKSKVIEFAVNKKPTSGPFPNAPKG